MAAPNDLRPLQMCPFVKYQGPELGSRLLHRVSGFPFLVPTSHQLLMTPSIFDGNRKKRKKNLCSPYLCTSLNTCWNIIFNWEDSKVYHQCVFRERIVALCAWLHDRDAFCVNHHKDMFFFPYLSITLSPILVNKFRGVFDFAEMVDVFCCQKDLPDLKSSFLRVVATRRTHT